MSDRHTSGHPDRRKQCMWLQPEVLEELQREGQRQERSLSWLVQRAWKIARAEIQRMPGADPAMPVPVESKE